MTMEHDDTTDTATTRSTDTSSDRTAVSDVDQRRRLTLPELSAFQVSVIGLTLIIAIGGVVATAPAVTGVSPGPSAPSVDAGASETTAIDPSGSAGPNDRPEVSGGFSRPTYTGVAGDPVRIRYTADNLDGDVYLLVGGNRLSDTGEPVDFVDVIKISGSSETTINTRTIGTDATNVDSCGRENTSCNLEFIDEDGDTVAKNLSGLPSATGAGGLARPLVPQRYRLAITNGTFVVDDAGVVTPSKSADQADLVLKKPQLRDEIGVFTTPDPSALDDDKANSLDVIRANRLDRTAVTKGNRIVLGFESTGIWGALSHFAAKRSTEPIEAGQAVDHRVLADLLTAEEGVSLQVRQTNLSGNEKRSELDLSYADSNDVKLFTADATALETPDAPGRFYLVIDTSDEGAFTHNPEPGDEFAVELALEGVEGQRYSFADSAEPPAAFDAVDDAPAQFPYWEAADSTARVETSFTVRERYVRYDHVTDDGEILVEAGDGRITGSTSLLSVPELSATFVNDASDTPFRTQTSLNVSEGNFSVNADLNGTKPGTRLNYELYHGVALQDSRTAIVVSDIGNPDELVIEDAPENVTVSEGANLSSIRATTRNAGGIKGEGELNLTVDNRSVIGSWGVKLAPDESRTYGFGSVTADLDPGTYPFTLRLDGDTHSGTLVVEADPAKTTIDDETSDSDSGGASEDGENNSDTGNETSDEDESGADTGNTSDTDEGSDEEGASNGTTNDDAPANETPDGGASQSVGMLPLPFGTREAFGGTILVGAVHLLGHWV
ncbi:hypothetical protein C464_14975 [Halorubrum coriense DSM 10284]|uniref:Uncharacterized protein n=1 Tax=Halorubrum coriense DSM 10284 TaxID=1227466 RepID=M0EAS9_9EURY|nr:hypothetical protein C464_14975 [Halorubrum coriense DSM 10284]